MVLFSLVCILWCTLLKRFPLATEPCIASQIHPHGCASSAASSVAAGVEARLKGKTNGPVGERTRPEGGRGRGGGRGPRQGTDRPSREETGDVDVGGAGERNSRARVPRGKDLGKRHEHDRFDGTGRG